MSTDEKLVNFLFNNTAYPLNDMEEFMPTVIKPLKNYIKTKNIPHLLFVGSCGFQKMEVALSFVDELFKYDIPNYKVVYASDPISKEEKEEAESMSRISASKLGSSAGETKTVNPFIDVRIKPFLEEKSIGKNSYKILIIDNFESLGIEQHAFRRLMEIYSSNCRMILLSNSSSDIIDPILSRCHTLFFPKISGKYFSLRINQHFGNMTLSQETMNELMLLSDGDIRKAILIGYYGLSKYNSLNERILKSVVRDKVYEVCKVLLSSILRNDFYSSINDFYNLIKFLYFDWKEFSNKFLKVISESNISTEEKKRIIIILSEYESLYPENIDIIFKIAGFLNFIRDKK